MDHRVKKVIALMEEYLHRGWPASRLAQFVNISPSRLHQLFKGETGLPPAKYLHTLRMQQAKLLLETSYLSIKEVMAKVGVADESHFVRDFKKIHGYTPAKYRERFMNARLDDETEHLSLAPSPTADLLDLLETGGSRSSSSCEGPNASAHAIRSHASALKHSD
jgi:AraC-like DNA-binding protein